MMPTRMPGMKPQLMMISAMATSEMYSSRSNCRDDVITQR
jgi:hypothetical protein